MRRLTPLFVSYSDFDPHFSLPSAAPGSAPLQWRDFYASRRPKNNVDSQLYTWGEIMQTWRLDGVWMVCVYVCVCVCRLVEHRTVADVLNNLCTNDIVKLSLSFFFLCYHLWFMVNKDEYKCLSRWRIQLNHQRVAVGNQRHQQRLRYRKQYRWCCGKSTETTM